MIKKLINQNTNYKLKLLDSMECEYIFNNEPINRLNNKNNLQEKLPNNKNEQIKELKNEINSIDNCKLKENAKNIILGDGNVNSLVMIIGGAPSTQDDLSGKTFSGDDGVLLEKMLMAINIKKKEIYFSYAVNFQPPLDRKPTTEEIRRYSGFLQKHISIIHPKLIILMGSTAMEALVGINSKISNERGIWKEMIIKNTNYKIIITFDPSYLLRIPENKKYSWQDLKKIKNKINELNLKI